MSPVYRQPDWFRDQADRRPLRRGQRVRVFFARHTDKLVAAFVTGSVTFVFMALPPEDWRWPLTAIFGTLLAFVALASVRRT